MVVPHVRLALQVRGPVEIHEPILVSSVRRVGLAPTAAVTVRTVVALVPTAVALVPTVEVAVPTAEVVVPTVVAGAATTVSRRGAWRSR